MAGDTTIAAVSSPPGAARRGVIRISGPETARVLARTCTVDGQALVVDRRTVLVARFHDGMGEQPALVLWMPAPHSFTREDVAELHLPGAPSLLERALACVLKSGADSAAPGEFTRRAFLNGRIDLTRAEGVLALVSACNQEQQRAATALLFGGLGERMEALRETLDNLRALCEASLDFDEADTGHVPTAELAEALAQVRVGLDEALGYEDRRAAHAGEPRVALVGEPNAGKSSLFNRLVGESKAFDRALVSGQAGTTRDAKGASWVLDGAAYRLVDTAGLDPEATGLEREAQRFSNREARAADLLLWVVDGTLGQEGARVLSRQAAEDAEPQDGIVVWNKTDAPGAQASPAAEAFRGVRIHGVVGVSARTGMGLADLIQAVKRFFGTGGAEEHAGVGRELYARHRDALVRAADEVDVAADGLASGAPLDLVAEALRAATEELDRISGRTTPETLLDRIFARFCLGK